MQVGGTRMIDMNSQLIITLRDYENIKRLEERCENALSAKEELNNLTDLISRSGYEMDCKEIASIINKIERML